jgi:hypothetical protein
VASRKIPDGTRALVYGVFIDEDCRRFLRKPTGAGDPTPAGNVDSSSKVSTILRDVVPVLIAALSSFLLTSAGASANPSGACDRFAVLPLVAGDTGLPYAIDPSPAERLALGERLGKLIAGRATPVVDPARVNRVMVGDGYGPSSRRDACDDAACARRIGQQLGVRTVIYGSVTRAMALIWSTEVSLVDVATGAARGPYEVGYKGDYLSLMEGLPALAQAVANQLERDSGCGAALRVRYVPASPETRA